MTALRNRLDAWVNLPAAPSIREVTRAAESVTVSIAEAYGTRARLWRSGSAGGAWEVVEDAVIQSAEGILTLTDGNAPERFAFYRVSLDFE